MGCVLVLKHALVGRSIFMIGWSVLLINRVKWVLVGIGGHWWALVGIGEY